MNVEGVEMLTYQIVRKVGNSYMVTIPGDTVDKLDLDSGQTVAVQIQRARVEMRPGLLPDAEVVVDAAIDDIGPALHYLGEN